MSLALDADISTRHLSCVETGRAQPSREIVLRLAETLQVPLRERNDLLLAAGYAPVYRHTDLDTPEMEGARRAVDFLLQQQEPYPVIVVDRYWNTLKMNSGTRHFLARFPVCESVKPHNGPRLVFHPKGLRPHIENWESVAARIIQRVHRKVTANPSDQTMKCFLEELLSYPAVPSHWHVPDLCGSPPLRSEWINLVLQFIDILHSPSNCLVDQPVRIDNINMLPDVSNRGPQNGTRPVGVDLSDDANRDVECTSVIVAPERASHRNSSLQMRSVDCINGTSGLSAGALLGLRKYDGQPLPYRLGKVCRPTAQNAGSAFGWAE
jgi:hypothetical protein